MTTTNAVRAEEARPAETSWRTVEPLATCRAALQRRPFLARHPLGEHPLFTIEALTKVAEAASQRHGDLWADAGDLSLTDKWGTTPAPDMPIPQLIDRIETAGAWIVMKHVEVDPRYKEILDGYEAFVRSVAAPEASARLTSPEMLVFMTSPRRKTPYHFDAEMNFIVQIHGAKDVWVCDPNDRSVTTEREIEEYYGKTISAGTYKPHAEEVAQKFTLRPGDALHVPSHAAHWVQNHDSVSVTLSLNMEYSHWRCADVYFANYHLRRLGLSPKPPGRAPLADAAKGAAVGALRVAKKTAQRALGR
ncbi:cupin-like domain-containing protein [Methylocella sp.]|uniref:cupin-like domain-containing protein n=1 Tax=Methylocella sp. TaxID=1978226 RepID=UPI0037831DC7